LVRTWPRPTGTGVHYPRTDLLPVGKVPPARLTGTAECMAKARPGGVLPARDADSVPGAVRAHARRALGATPAPEGKNRCADADRARPGRAHRAAQGGNAASCAALPRGP